MIQPIFLFYFNWILHAASASICDYSDNGDPLCCSGWIKNVYGDCVKSECDYDCGYGKCIGLNVCECHDKTIRSETCPPANQRICINGCSNRGQCMNGKCICESGYLGEDCNKTSISTCYVKVNRGLCKTTSESIQLTKEECCSIFQVAWGNPCIFCERNTYCPKGHILRNSQCEDINECEIKSICLNGACINEKGSFRCQCPPEFYLDEVTMSCQYNKEITIPDPCVIYGTNCGAFGQCVILSDGQYKCICKSPYKVSENGKSCEKHSFYNVCKLYRNLCLPYGECQPSGLSYFCNCMPGFHQTEDRKSCIVNSNSDICQNVEIADRCRGGQCVSEGSSYKCICNGEYKSYNNGQECVRYITPEQSSGTFCSRVEYYSLCQGGECVETDNGYYCKCASGYYATENRRKCDKKVMDGKTKGDSDNPYCSSPEYSSRCKGGQCISDKIYGFKCLCLSGYTVSTDGRLCEESYTDACLTNGYKCQLGRCRRTGNNDYQCICPDYMIKSKDGRSCVNYYKSTESSQSRYCDIPTNRGRCATGDCVADNYYGFKCICKDGYQVSEDGRACNKIDDQPTEPVNRYCDIVSNRARCATGDCIANKYYGFRCICKDGYKGSEDGRACYKIVKITSLCGQYQLRCQGGGCLDIDENKYECQCLEGYSRSSDGQYCTKTQRFTDYQSICDRFGSRCLSGVCYAMGLRDYMCICAPGYFQAQDKKSCIKNEDPKCAENQQRCKGGLCYDITDGYVCICSEKYSVSRDGRDCLPRAFSLKSHFQSDFFSVNAKYKSICDTQGVIEKCQPGVCVEQPNYYRCQCPYSFKTSENELECIRDETKCPYCFYGCLNKISNCLCPETYEDLYNTGLCILKSNKISHTLGSPACQSNSVNKTLIINFHGLPTAFGKSSADVYESVSKLLLIKQHKSIRLSFCVPIRKHHSLFNRFQLQRSNNGLISQIVCIFDC